jgi:hypothetical protein
MFRASKLAAANVGSFLTRKMNVRTVRQRHETGPQYNGRQTFKFPTNFLRLHRRQLPMDSAHRDEKRPETWHRHMEGDAATKPIRTFSETDRQDKVVAQWRPRGRLSLHHVGGKTETFVCFRCGYPVKSKLVAVKDGNWDYRMCYKCYSSTVRNGLENET